MYGTNGGLDNDVSVIEEERDSALNASVNSSSLSSNASSNNYVFLQETESSAPVSVPVADVPDVKGTPSDPALVGGDFWEQWHHTGTYGLNDIPVWQDYTGEGIKVAVFDDGVNYNHSELSANYRSDLDYDTLDNDNDAINQGQYHGTNVSQIIAADDNGARIVGVAFDSEIVGIRRGFNAQSSNDDALEGFQHALTADVDVMNNSWGTGAAFGDNKKINFVGADVDEILDAVIDLANLGRDGLGTTVVFSAGNDRVEGISANYKNYQNSPYTITVGAINESGTFASFSAAGSNLLVTAPGDGLTVSSPTDTSSASIISGTSFSAPAVAGVVALMLEANADLGYRDVQEILAMSSRQIDAGGTGWAGEGWQTNGSTNWNGGGMHFSHDYGYGNVDALAAVRLAETWNLQQTYANLNVISPVTSAPALALPATGTVVDTIDIATDMEIEHVIIDLDITHDRAGDLVVTLTSPDGTDSVLMYNVANGTFTTTYGVYQGVNFEFSSTAHWGESSAGTWTLTIEDNVGGNSGTLNDWSLSFLGKAQSNDDLYVYTNEYAGMTGPRTFLSDNDGGTDTINTAAVTGNTTINLSDGSATVAGNLLVIQSPGNFENIHTGDGNDILTGNAADNTISGGRGDDSFYGSAGNDLLYGDQGTDTVFYNQNITEFLINLVNATTVSFVNTGGTYGVDTLFDFEFYNFNGALFTRSDIDQYVADGGGVVSMRMTLGWDGGAHLLKVNDPGGFTYSGVDIGRAGMTQDVLHVIRTATTMNATALNPGSGEVDSIIFKNDDATATTLTGFRSLEVDHGGANNNVSVTIDQAMRGRITTNSGDDIINVTLQEITAFNPGDIDQWFITSGSGDDQITIDGAITNMFGTIDTGNGNDIVDINVQGNDAVTAGAGDDVLNLGSGADRGYGGAGDDTLYGEGGDDKLYGDEGLDTLYGGDGFDWLEGGDGVDHLHGGNQNDRLYGDAGDDVLNGDDGNDVLKGGADNDTLNGGNGNDELFGNDGIDILNGGDGRDFMRGDDGNDTLHGGLESDKLYGNNGNDILNGDAGFDALYGGADNDILNGGLDSDRLYGQSGNDRLIGGDGNDILSAGTGTDVLIGGEGADRMYGGGGQDTFALTVFDAGVERFYNFTSGTDIINITDILTGYTHGVDDIADFVQILDLGNGNTDLRINADGTGMTYTRAALIYNDLGGVSAQDMIDNGTLVADVSV